MKTKLPPLIASFVDAMNSHDIDGFVQLFAADAVVQDEAREHRGPAAIREWIEEAWRKYNPRLDPTAVTEEESETILTGTVSGTFDGSPVELRHFFAIEGGQITTLTIKV